MVRKITGREQEICDYADGRYLFFDKSLQTHLIKSSLAIPNVLRTDEKTTELRRLYRQMFGTAFEDYVEQKTAQASSRQSSNNTLAGIATLLLAPLSLGLGALTVVLGADYFQIWGALSVIWGLLALPAGVRMLLRRRWGRLLCVIESGLALAIGLFVFALSGPCASFALAGFIVYAAYAVMMLIIVVFPKAGAFTPDG
jgi:hypothetical protein